MNIKFDYTIDNKPYTWQDLIKKAKEWGWNSGEISTTSGAAAYLRKTGHTVGVFGEVKE